MNQETFWFWAFVVSLASLLMFGWWRQRKSDEVNSTKQDGVRKSAASIAAATVRRMSFRGVNKNVAYSLILSAIVLGGVHAVWYTVTPKGYALAWGHPLFWLANIVFLAIAAVNGLEKSREIPYHLADWSRRALLVVAVVFGTFMLPTLGSLFPNGGFVNIEGLFPRTGRTATPASRKASSDTGFRYETEQSVIIKPGDDPRGFKIPKGRFGYLLIEPEGAPFKGRANWSDEWVHGVAEYGSSFSFGNNVSSFYVKDAGEPILVTFLISKRPFPPGFVPEDLIEDDEDDVPSEGD